MLRVLCERKCRKCGEMMPPREITAYGSYCEDCYSTVWIYLGKQQRRFMVRLSGKSEPTGTRFYQTPKARKKKAKH